MIIGVKMSPLNESKLDIPEREYITKNYEHISVYASEWNNTVNYVKTMIRHGLIVSAVYCEGEIYIDIDEDLPDYISARQFALLKNADHHRVINDVKAGKYQTAIIESNGRIFMDSSEECLPSSYKVERVKKSHKTKYDIPEGYVRFDEFAPEKGLNHISIATRAKRGGIESAMKVKSKWCAKRSELEEIYKRFAIPPNDDYITAQAYAELHNQSRQTTVNYAKAGHYESAIRYGRDWYIDKNEKPYYEEFISIPNYATAHDMTEDEVMTAIDEGKLKHRKHVMHGKLYIHKDEIL